MGRTLIRRVAVVAGLVLSSTTAQAARPVAFTTSEGTWMSVDVSPDGRTIVFDLLGDLYTLPIAGGKATRITDGRAYDTQPRWSPDGRSIAFSSDRSGSDNLWIVEADGSSAHAVTSEKDGGISEPGWTPDGEYLVVRKDPTYNRLGSAELWLYPRSGGQGVRLLDRQARGGINPNGPVASPDGRWIYFSHGNRSLDATWVPWQIWRLDHRGGQQVQVTTGFHGAVRPALSPDGSRLAYIRRDHAKSTLVLRDLETGIDRDVLSGLNRDEQRGATDYDAYPGYAFMPDGKSIVITTGGKIHRVSLDTPGDVEIPFTADVALDLADRAYVPHRISDDPLIARIIRWPTFTPDGKTFVFEALGKLWISTGGGAPRRLTESTTREYAPAISPDGKSVAYVSWDDKERGHLWKLSLPSGKPQQLTRVARQYANPSWSPDGSKIVLVWRVPRVAPSAMIDDDPYHSIVWIAADGGATHDVTTVAPLFGGRWYPVPRFSGDGARVQFIAVASPTRTDLVSVRLDGTDRRALARFKYVDEAAASPDGTKVAFVSMDDLYVTDIPAAGREPFEIDLDRPAAPLRRVTTDGGGYVSWTSDGRGLTWSYANVAYRQPLDTEKPEAFPIEVTAARAVPSGSVLLKGARIVTMRGDEVIERGDVLVTGNRIAAIGRAGSLRVPAGARVENLSGKTIIPGIVDTHNHAHYAGREIFPQEKWPYLADLAYGVTTARDVSAPTRDLIAQADMVETGDMIGPRVFGTGWPLFAAGDGGGNQHVTVLSSLDDARRHVKRLKRNGVTYLKQYLQPRREQRQWVQQAALEEGVMVTAEGGGLRVQTTLVLDGYTGFEHGIPVAPIYNDLVQLMARAQVFYTPTFLAGYAKPTPMEYVYGKFNVHDDLRASRFVPHDLLDRLTATRLILPEDQLQFRLAARGAAAIVQAGGHVTVGAHGNHPGLGPHWELWSYVEGGMTPLQAIRIATMGGAECLGIQQDIGSVETGKIADLVILNSDPRTDIHRTTDVYRVVKNGHVLIPDDLAARLQP